MNIKGSVENSSILLDLVSNVNSLAEINGYVIELYKHSTSPSRPCQYIYITVLFDVIILFIYLSLLFLLLSVLL